MLDIGGASLNESVWLSLLLRIGAVKKPGVHLDSFGGNDFDYFSGGTKPCLLTVGLLVATL